MIREYIKQRNDRINNAYENLDCSSLPKGKIRLYSCFDITCLDASLEEIEKNLIYTKEDIAPIYISERKDISDISDILDHFLNLYQYEVGSIKDEKAYQDDIDQVFLISSTILDEKLRITNDFKHIGIIFIIDDQIDIVWIHPFFRNKGIMTFFAMQQLEQEKIISVSEPISNSMMNFLKSFQIKIETHDELKEKFRIAVLKKIIKILGDDDSFCSEILTIDFETSKKLMSSYNDFFEIVKDNDLSNSEIKFNIKMMIATIHLAKEKINDSNREDILNLLDDSKLSEVDKMKEILKKLNFTS